MERNFGKERGEKREESENRKERKERKEREERERKREEERKQIDFGFQFSGNRTVARERRGRDGAEAIVLEVADELGSLVIDEARAEDSPDDFEKMVAEEDAVEEDYVFA